MTSETLGGIVKINVKFDPQTLTHEVVIAMLAKLFLRAIVMNNERWRDPGLPCNFAQRGRLEAVTAEYINRGITNSSRSSEV